MTVIIVKNAFVIKTILRNTYKWVNKFMNEIMNDWMNESTNEWMYG